VRFDPIKKKAVPIAGEQEGGEELRKRREEKRERGKEEGKQ